MQSGNGSVTAVAGRGFSGALDSEIERLRLRYGHLAARPLLEAVITEEFPGRIAVLSSFGTESGVILSLVSDVDRAVPVIFLDTGKHFPDTLEYRDRLVERLGLTNLSSLTPQSSDLDRDDPVGRLHRHDPDRCCYLRKVLPLERGLAGHDAWITGRKRYHGGERVDLGIFEAVDSRIKINPLAGWSPKEIAAEFHRRNLPIHPMMKAGFLSIGCAPCTAPVAADSPVRSGRWADGTKTECGIHGAKWAQMQVCSP